MSSLADLQRHLQSTNAVAEPDLHASLDILRSFWYDTPAIIGTAKEADLVKINIAPHVATALIEEARKLVEASSKSKTGSDYSRSYNYGSSSKPYTKKNYGISDDLEVAGAKGDGTLDTIQVDDSVTPGYVRFFNVFINGEHDRELRKASLKKIKFVLAKIIQAPEMKEWRVIDTDGVEINRLILRYPSLCKVFQVLGFKMNTRNQMELKPNDVNLELLQSCLEYVKDLLKPPKADFAIDDTEVTFGPQPLNEIEENKTVLRGAYETITHGFKEYVLPRVRVLETQAARETAVESRRKLFEGMVHRRKRQQESTEREIQNQKTLLSQADNFLSAKQQKEMSDGVERMEKTLEQLGTELQQLESHLKALPKAKVMLRRASEEAANHKKPSDGSENTYAKEEYRKRLRKIFPDSDFPADPPQDPQKLVEFEKIQDEIEANEGQFKELFQNDAEMVELFHKLRCYAQDSRAVLAIVRNDLPLLEIDISKGERVQTVYDLIGYKLGLLDSGYTLCFKGSNVSLDADGRTAILRNLSRKVDFYEVLEMRETADAARSPPAKEATEFFPVYPKYTQ